MQKIWIGDDASTNKKDVRSFGPFSFDELQEEISKLDIYANCVNRGKFANVIVQYDVGTSQMLANAGGDHNWLKKISESATQNSVSITYKIKLK